MESALNPGLLICDGIPCMESKDNQIGEAERLSSLRRVTGGFMFHSDGTRIVSNGPESTHNPFTSILGVPMSPLKREKAMA